MLGIGRTQFENIRDHLINNGPLPKHKKNASMENKDDVIDKNVAEIVKNFLENYAEVHKFPSPGRNII